MAGRPRTARRGRISGDVKAVAVRRIASGRGRPIRPGRSRAGARSGCPAARCRGNVIPRRRSRSSPPRGRSGRSTDWVPSIDQRSRKRGDAGGPTLGRRATRITRTPHASCFSMTGATSSQGGAGPPVESGVRTPGAVGGGRGEKPACTRAMPSATAPAERRASHARPRLDDGDHQTNDDQQVTRSRRDRRAADADRA